MAPCTEFGSLLQSPIVRIQCGTPGYELPVHTKLLCHNIPFFKPILQYDLEVLPMRAWSAGCLQLFAQWLYEDRLTYTIADGLPNSVPILDLYFLGLKLGVVRLRNLAIDHLRRISAELCAVPEAVNIEDIYQKTEPASPLRLLMARMVAHYIISCDPQKDDGTCKTYLGLAERNDEFRLDFTTAMKHVIETDIADPAEGDDEVYHEPDDGGCCDHHPRELDDDDPMYDSQEVDDAVGRRWRESRSERAPSITPSTPPPRYSRYP